MYKEEMNERWSYRLKSPGLPRVSCLIIILPRELRRKNISIYYVIVYIIIT